MWLWQMGSELEKSFGENWVPALPGQLFPAAPGVAPRVNEAGGRRVGGEAMSPDRLASSAPAYPVGLRTLCLDLCPCVRPTQSSRDLDGAGQASPAP